MSEWHAVESSCEREVDVGEGWEEGAGEVPHGLVVESPRSSCLA